MQTRFLPDEPIATANADALGLRQFAGSIAQALANSTVSTHIAQSKNRFVVMRASLLKPQDQNNRHQ